MAVTHEVYNTKMTKEITNCGYGLPWQFSW